MSNNSRWLCPKCKTNNELSITRCGLCSAPKPINTPTIDERSNPSATDIKLTQMLHNAIDKMGYAQKNKTWCWLENNVL